MIETELIGEISQNTFSKKLSEFKRKFGKPIERKRLALMITHIGSKIDTRIRITNGVAEIMQKVQITKETNGLRIKEEIPFPLNSNIDDILTILKIISNLTIDSKNRIRLVVQIMSYTWSFDEYELKIAHQFGLNDYYIY